MYKSRSTETLYLLPKRFNYNPQECKDFEAFCADCGVYGIAILHGLFGTFRRKQAADENENPFHFIYRMFEQVKYN